MPPWRQPIDRLLVVLAMLLAAAAVGLFADLPANSLKVRVVYQGF